MPSVRASAFEIHAQQGFPATFNLRFPRFRGLNAFLKTSQDELSWLARNLKRSYVLACDTKN